MIELFEQVKEYKLKSDQVREVTRKKIRNKKLSLIETVISKISALNRQLQALDIQGSAEDERLTLMRALQTLEITISNIKEGTQNQ